MSTGIPWCQPSEKTVPGLNCRPTLGSCREWASRPRRACAAVGKAIPTFPRIRPRLVSTARDEVQATEQNRLKWIAVTIAVATEAAIESRNQTVPATVLTLSREDANERAMDHQHEHGPDRERHHAPEGEFRQVTGEFENQR